MIFALEDGKHLIMLPDNFISCISFSVFVFSLLAQRPLLGSVVRGMMQSHILRFTPYGPCIYWANKSNIDRS